MQVLMVVKIVILYVSDLGEGERTQMKLTLFDQVTRCFRVLVVKTKFSGNLIESLVIAKNRRSTINDKCCSVRGVRVIFIL